MPRMCTHLCAGVGVAWSEASPRTSGRVACCGVAHRAGHHQAMPREEHDHRTHRSADEAHPLVQTIPAQLLAQVGRNEGPSDPQQRPEDKTRRVAGPGKQVACDDPGDKADKDDPEDVYGRVRATCAAARWSSVVAVGQTLAVQASLR
jgi:hypothetical protein